MLNFEGKCKLLNTEFGLNKSDFMFDTHFAVIVQNSRKDWYYSDMLLDCFACGVVPIYFGSNGYQKVFDKNGVIEIKEPSDLAATLGNLSLNDYHSRKKAITKNFTTVKGTTISIR